MLDSRSVPILFIAAAFAAVSPIAAKDERVFSERTIREAVAVDASVDADCRVIVDNVWGDVRVGGRSRPEVAVVAVETVWAESAAAAERAAREVTLEVGAVGADGAGVLVLVNGPFRDRENPRRWARQHRDPGYTVVYDLTLEVPARCDLEVKTINDGEVEVAEIAGALDVSNVNGGIRLDRVSSPGGEVRTVNGPIIASFLRGPTEPLSFRSVNGRLEVSFPPRLSADLRVESVWGEMWSEFELAPLRAAPPARRHHDGGLLIEVGRGAELRAGVGGPEISFETLNGDILIRKEG